MVYPFSILSFCKPLRSNKLSCFKKISRFKHCSFKIYNSNFNFLIQNKTNIIFIGFKLFKSTLKHDNCFIYNKQKVINSKLFRKRFYNFILNISMKLFLFMTNTFFTKLRLYISISKAISLAKMNVFLNSFSLYFSKNERRIFNCSIASLMYISFDYNFLLTELTTNKMWHQIFRPKKC